MRDHHTLAITVVLLTLLTLMGIGIKHAHDEAHAVAQRCLAAGGVPLNVRGRGVVCASGVIP